MEFNKYQTKLDEETLKSLPRAVREELMEYIDTVPFIKNLIAPENVRGYARDKKRYDDPNLEEDRIEDINGRICVDVTNPHILEDVDFFRERALFFDKYGKYTDIRPNPNPKSEYFNFWKEEVRRWKEGLIRPSDGEWVPGYYYFYLNYLPIFINEEVKTGTGKISKKRVKGVRKREFPKFWLGDYLFYHYIQKCIDNGAHAKLLKSRGVGYSWKMGAMTPCSMYVNKGLPNFHLASNKTFLEGDKGVFGKVINCLDWVASHTPLDKLRLIDRPLEKKIGYKDEIGVEKGLLSSVFGISMKDDSDKARGIRGAIIHYEEDGVFPNLEDTWNINRNAAEEGSVTFSLMVSGGTGGSLGADFAGSEKLFYNPDAYNIYGVNNVYDKNANESKQCGLFWGGYLNRSRCYDKDTGEPDVIKALIEILLDRDDIKKSSTDPQAITQRCAEIPLTPQEAVMRVEGTLFPVHEIRNYLEQIGPIYQKMASEHYIGDLVESSGGIVWVPNKIKYPIYEFPIKDKNSNKDGAIEIIEMPKRDSNGEVFKNRYILGADTIDDDEANSSVSLTSIFVFDIIEDKIVAEYTGRPKYANDFYEICRKLTIFYNGILCYENNKKGLFTYFSNKNCLYLLCDTPEILKDMQLVKASASTYGNSMKGVNANKLVNQFGRRLQRDWLLSEAQTQDFDENGVQKSNRLNLHNIRLKALLLEWLQWNVNLNCDRISALNMVFILREQVRKMYLSNNDNLNVTQYDEEDYFYRNYEAKLNKYKLAISGWNENNM